MSSATQKVHILDKALKHLIAQDQGKKKKHVFEREQESWHSRKDAKVGAERSRSCIRDWLNRSSAAPSFPDVLSLACLPDET